LDEQLEMSSRRIRVQRDPEPRPEPKPVTKSIPGSVPTPESAPPSEPARRGGDEPSRGGG
jgi:hypothetical protein